MEEMRATASTRPSPDHESAVFAVAMADDMLLAARESFSVGDLQGALDHSRDAIRIASSALMFRDGYITDDFDKTVRYLARRYDSIFPLRDWERVEMTYLGAGGLYNMLLKAMGKQERSDREKASEALSVAERFLDKAREELGV